MNQLPKNGEHIFMSPEERGQWYQTVKEEHDTHLQQFDVKLPKANSARALQLIFLRKYMGTLVHKDTISAFITNVSPNYGKDQQIRHLASDGWFVLNKGDKIRGEETPVPNGYHVLVTTEEPKPTFLFKAIKRAGRMSAQNFEQLKHVYGNRCATCGSIEGKPHLQFPTKRTELQKGHMDPNKPLTLENTIPQCQVCNQTYQDDFVFDEKGRVITVASAKPVLRSDERTKKIVLEALEK